MRFNSQWGQKPTYKKKNEGALLLANQITTNIKMISNSYVLILTTDITNKYLKQ